MNVTSQELLQKFSDLQRDRETWEGEAKEITRFVMPRRSIFDDQGKRRGERTGQDIYDGTAISALNLLANGLMGYLMSQMIRWFKLGLPDQRALDVPGARRWLEFAENVLYADFSRSTVYEEGLEFFKDFGSVATATMYMEEDLQEGVPWFSTRHPKEVYLDTDRRNRVDTVTRRYWMSARAMAQEFGANNLPYTIQRDLTEAPYERHEVLHFVFPRTDRDVTKINSQNKRFASIYMDKATGEILRESGYDEFPYVIGRWSTNSDEQYGRGPAHDALVKVKRGNAMARDMMQASQLSVRPPLNVPASLRNQYKWTPAGANYYTNPSEIVTPAMTGINYRVGLEQEQDLRQIIEADFMVDFFLMLQRAPERMTATEVMERQAEKAAVLGPVIGRIESDVLDKIISLTFAQAVKAGRIPPPPPALRRFVGMPIKVEYIGPLAQANRKFHMQQGIQQAMNMAMPLLEIAPETRGMIKWDDLMRKMLQEGGMPADVVRDRREYAEWQAQMAQAQARAEQQAQQQEIMQNADKLGKSPEAGSPLDELSRQMSGVMQQVQGGAA